ncbi:hypothetical protein EDB81DRAFT_925073 [Dactylonectria macrodidyma]|uniref:Uncharacterized protein n=1 Tax=Dactylonectria macrodidyma TaxID=307937 RepID=A0A9P9JCL1_9HYPO|nr:hypothetical protein EDB81DRAFT_925073 [Dactylonectria macrodidyma]
MSQPKDTPKDGNTPSSFREVTKEQQPSRLPLPSQPLSSLSLGHQFPPSFNLYRGGFFSSSYKLGQHKNQPLYVFSYHSGWSSTPPVLLHSGPDTSYPQLASASWRSFSSSFFVELPAAPSFGAGRRTHENWRHSRGDAVKSLGGRLYGYKLVRLAQGPPRSRGTGNGGDMNFVDSAGKEIVAAWAGSRGSSTKEGEAKFRFMGTGLTGLLGERWAIMAVVTFLALF